MPSHTSSPLHLNPAPREPAFAFLSRVAAIGGSSAVDFGKDIGALFPKVLEGASEALDALAEVTGTTRDQLEVWQPRKTAASTSRRNLAGHLFPSRYLLTSHVRGCIACLKEDIEQSQLPAHRAMTYRANWLIPHVSLCQKHNQALVTLWVEPKPTLRYDTSARFLDIAVEVQKGRPDSEHRDPTDFDVWFEGRLSGAKPEALWINQFPLHAASNFCRLLGYALLRLEGISPQQVAHESDWACYQMGFEVVSRGEQAILDAFLKLNRTAEPRLGPKAVFPILYDRLSHDYVDEPDYAKFRSLLATHLKQTWPLGPGDELMGEPVTERCLHSVATASAATGVDSRRLRKMLEAQDLIDPTMPDAWAVFDARHAEQILAPLTQFMTAKGFATAHGMSRSQFDLLVKDGVLTPSLSGANTKHVWDPREGQKFLESILDGAETLYQAQHGWEHISKSANRLKCGPGDIIRALSDGRIQRVGRNVQFEGYRSVHVYHEEVAQALGSEEPAAMSLHLFSKAIGLGQPVFLNRLVKNGHVPATQIRNPKTKARQRYITDDDARAFHAKFVTLRTLSKAKGTTWQRLSAQLRQANISPFSPDGVDYGYVYLKEDVMDL
ncbi:TniQ family protein [Pacificibacter marinus]|uniref:TniQ family protein n=1 Tax=Pacificibacter marinus TaxID=658057 RepID=UPI001C074CC6|nr:TniQ family protein [Pacificibacter marinus]MBU2865991.1 TniQ family protein [Pacificibacter marinus]